MSQESLMWQCSDPDTLQYYKKVSDYRWAFIEARQLLGGEHLVCHTVIDFTEYTFDDMWEYCSGYYDSYEDIVNDYGFRNAIRIMLECVFEQLDPCEMRFAKKCKSYESAQRFIEQWMERNRCEK